MRKTTKIIIYSFLMKMIKLIQKKKIIIKKNIINQKTLMNLHLISIKKIN